MPTWKNCFFGLQNFVVPYWHKKKNFFINFELYNLETRIKSCTIHAYMKKVFLPFKTLLSPIGTQKRNFFINFELYDLSNGKE
jgi:hypothetical protein